DFELVVLTPGEKEQKVTDIEWSRNRYAKRPPTVFFGPDDHLLFTEYVGDSLTLKKITLSGRDEQTLYTFAHATRAVVSPTMEWVAFREYHRSYITPFEFAGKPVVISAADGKGFTERVDADEDGDFMEWSPDGQLLTWTRGQFFYEKSLQDILARKASAEKTKVSFEYEIDIPTTVIALQNVRVLTMNADKDVLEGVSVVIRGNRISAIGKEAEIPGNAKVYDLQGRTLMPGIFDAHGHYGSRISALNVIEQRLYGLHANLAYGVTTMYDVYGTTQKDFWVSDMLQKGNMIGPRIYSVGDPIFVTKYRTKMHRSIRSAEDALEHVRFNKDHGAFAVKDYSNHTRAARQHLAAASRQLEINLISESFADPQMNLTQVIDGFTGLEHSMGVEPLYEDVLRLFEASEIGMTPTLIVVYNGPSGETYFHQSERLWEDDKLLNFFRKDELLRYRRPNFFWSDDHYAARMAKAVKKLYDRGVLLQMGAHGQMMGLGAHWEMELFTHGGFTPHQAIEIATINGFKHHGLGHELGSIEVGKIADLVILTENPLQDIRNTRAIEYVLKNGVVYSGQDASRVYPDPKPAEPLYFKR
ncbi:amidohydrolase family protein, partial [bacterium]|nr:amidohydrolase family protein [bacterium]